MIRVSCRAGLVFRLLLDCGDEDPAIEIVKAHMKEAAENAARDLKRLDTGYQVDLEIDYLVAYEVTAKLAG